MRLFVRFIPFIPLLLLSLPLVGSRPSRELAPALPRTQELSDLRISAQKDFVKGNVEIADEKLKRGLRKAQAIRSPYDEAGFLLSLGNCSLSLNNYRKAMEHYTAGGEIALENRFSDLAIRFASNRASIYRLLGDHDSARAALRPVSGLIGSNPEPRLLLQLGKVAGQSGDLETAMSSFNEAVRKAEDKGDNALESSIWDQIGKLYLDNGDLVKAEEHLTRAFRIRRLLAPRDLPYSYYSLAVLRNAQGDSASAVNLVNSAVAAGLGRSQVAPPFLFFERAKAKAALGKTMEALSDYERAIELAKQWRLEVLPSDTFRISAETGLNKIYSGYIDTGMLLYLRGGSVPIRDRMLEASEENRAVSFREALRSRTQYPHEYLSLLDRLRRSLTTSLDDADEGLGEAALEDALLQVAEFETKMGLQQRGSVAEEDRQTLVKAIQSGIGSDAVFISFQLGRERSFVWAISGHNAIAAELEGSASLLERVHEFRTAVASGDTAVSPRLGQSLYTSLFGGIGSVASGKRNWVISPGSGLWDLPFAALTVEPGHYLVERHSLRMLPSAALLRGTETSPMLSGLFVGLANPIYNAADPRRSNTSETGSGIQYASLPGSKKEVDDAARSWNGRAPQALLTGDDITRLQLTRALAGKPSVVHIATHLVQHPQAKDQVMIALGYRESGEQEFLHPAEVASWRCPVGVIVLSGCGSGKGKVLPGEGLLGMTRSWLLAGARSVVATHWPIPDDSGPMFETFYRDLSHRGGELNAEATAIALQHSQVAMLSAGGWRAKPNYWSAFFVVGRN